MSLIQTALCTVYPPNAMSELYYVAAKGEKSEDVGKNEPETAREQKDDKTAAQSRAL